MQQSFPPKLRDTRRLLHTLGNPHEGMRTIHIAGTNGKGSTAAFTASILQCAGYKTGLFTSPHLLRFNERIRVNGADIPDDALNTAMARVDAATAALGLAPNYFRRATAAALLYFRECGCDFAVLETGMGGRLDPTNAIEKPEITVITRIGMDHEGILGNLLTAIAQEKAGVIKPGVPVLCARQLPDAGAVLEKTAHEKHVRLYWSTPAQYTCRDGLWVLHGDMGDIPLKNGGIYQAENAALAVDTARILRTRGIPLEAEDIFRGISGTSWPARFEIMAAHPTILFDGAHNPGGVCSLMESIGVQWPGAKVVCIMGSMQDKDYVGSIKLAAASSRAMIAVPVDDTRSLGADVLAAAMRAHCDSVYAAKDIKDAVLHAKTLCQAGDIICVFGSLYLFGPLKEALQV